MLLEGHIPAAAHGLVQPLISMLYTKLDTC